MNLNIETRAGGVALPAVLLAALERVRERASEPAANEGNEGQ